MALDKICNSGRFGLFINSNPNANSGRVNKASTAETVNLGSIPGLVKPKAIKIGIHSFSVRRSAIKRTV